MIILKGKAETAIALSVFAAFIGAIGGIAVLFHFWKKYRPQMNELRRKSQKKSNIKLTEIYVEVIRYSIPMIFVGIANPLFQLVDMLTFNNAMKHIGMSEVSDLYLSMLNFTTHKVVIIPVMLATSLSLALFRRLQNISTVMNFTCSKGQWISPIRYYFSSHCLL